MSDGGDDENLGRGQGARDREERGEEGLQDSRVHAGQHVRVVEQLVKKGGRHVLGSHGDVAIRKDGSRGKFLGGVLVSQMP